MSLFDCLVVCLALFLLSPLLAILGGGKILSILFARFLAPVAAPAAPRHSQAWHRELDDRLSKAKERLVAKIELAERTSSRSRALIFRARLDSRRIRCFLDTGSDYTFVAKSLAPEKLDPAEETFKGAFGGPTVKSYGTFTFFPRFGAKTYPVTAHVVDDHLVPHTRSVLLGMDWYEEHSPVLMPKRRAMHFGDSRRTIAAIRPDAVELKHHTTTGMVPASYLEKFAKLFSEPSQLPPSRPGFDVKLKVTGEAAPSREIRVKDPAKQKFIKDFYDENVKRGYLEPRAQPEVNPCSAFVVQSGGTDGTGAAKPRLVLDFVKLNAVTDVMPSILPRISDLIEEVCKSSHLSKIDLRNGFYNLRIHPESVEKTATLFPGCGIAVWKVLPMGLADAPGRFQALMTHELRDLIDAGGVRVYLDDIIVHASSQEEHDRILDLVFTRLESRDYHLKASKCAINVSSVDFLGHRIENGTYKPQHSTVQGIVDFPFPQTIQQWQRFHGMANFYRKHIPRFSDVMRPIATILGLSQRELDNDLTDIPKEARAQLVKLVKNKDPALVTSFEEIKRALAAASSLTSIDPSRELFCITDASKAAWGAIITHDPSGQEAPVAWLSGSFSSAEKGWHSIHREIFALVASIKRYPEYFAGPVTVLTDSEHLTQWTSLAITSERLARWNEILVEHQLKLRHIPGNTNIVADALSRSVDKMNDDWAGKVFPATMLAPIRTKQTCATPPPAGDSRKTYSSRRADQSLPSITPRSQLSDHASSNDFSKAPASPVKSSPVPPKTGQKIRLVTKLREIELDHWSDRHIEAQKFQGLGVKRAFDDKELIDEGPPGSSYERIENPPISKDPPATLGCPIGCDQHFSCREARQTTTPLAPPPAETEPPKELTKEEHLQSLAWIEFDDRPYGRNDKCWSCANDEWTNCGAHEHLPRPRYHI